MYMRVFSITHEELGFVVGPLHVARVLALELRAPCCRRRRRPPPELDRSSVPFTSMIERRDAPELSASICGRQPSLKRFSRLTCGGA